MTLNDVVFIDQFPKLDLHGYDRETARVAIEDFIRDNIKLKNEIIIIVHGIGSGILKDTTRKTLSISKKVLEFKTYYFNNGCTVARISL